MQIVNYPGHPPVSRPFGPAPLTPALRRGDWVMTSGKVGIDPGTAQIADPGFAEQPRQAFRNSRALLSNAGMEVSDAMKVTVPLARAEDSVALNDINRSYFSEPCRSSLMVARPPASLLIEAEATACRPGAGA
ncbi:RidA family protein [Poseidonocella sp. HB161398]|uniref:RidA family protein n=1 Tax=Poseidonocella sp. HB161398 TaxID=2320855 RepID=UPI001108B132|nr:Rid family hydrolase [Poseidonocella sp. HB161398]